MRNLMIDLETMSTRGDAAIIQIGACFFDEKSGSRVGRPFEINVDLQNCIDLGLRVDAGAIEFWMKQAKKDWMDGERVDLAVALRMLSDFVRTYGTEPFQVWNHKSFDAPILHNAFVVTRIDSPFSYRDVLDIRTLNRITGYKPDKSKNPNQHNALADCIFQSVGVAEALAMIQKVVVHPADI